jgi:hypothetical protein
VFDDGSALHAHKVRRLDGSTTLTAAPGAEASVGFRREARCELGPSSSPSEIVTRSPEEADLFRQTQGRTQCRVGHSDADVGFFCGVTDGCPAVLTTNGEFVARSLQLAAASAVGDDPVERTTIIICSGFATVRVEDEHGYSEVSGGGTGNNEFVVVIEQGDEGSTSVQSTSTYQVTGACRRRR